MTILIVDDIGMNLKLLRAQLEAEGHTILEAGDGVEALDVLNREPVAAVISDILMPNLDGFGFCLAVRKDERLRTLPFIFYTSTYTSASDMKLARTVGANAYLSKPAPVQALIAALRDASFQMAPPVPPDETAILKQHNLALLKKLEQKDTSLKRAAEKLGRAHERIAEANIIKGTIGRPRKKDESGSGPVRRVRLSVPRPTCPNCQRIRDEKNSWHSMERYHDPHARPNPSHAICEECDKKHTTQLDQFMKENALAIP